MGYHQAVNVSKELIPAEDPDPVNLAVWTAILLRKGRTDKALKTAAKLRKLIRASGEVRPLKGEESEELNNLFWVTATLTERAYMLEALFILEYMLKQAESPDNTTSSALARAKYHLLQSKIYEKLGRKTEYQQSLAKFQAAWNE